MGKAWLNLGISLAESGKLDDAEVMFIKAADCEPEVKPQALTNLALLEKERVQRALAGGDAAAAKTHGLQAGRYLDEAKPLFDALIPLFPNDEGLRHYASGFDQLRIFVFRLAGAALMKLGEFADCEAEMTKLVDMFPDAWESHAMMWTMHMNTGNADGAEPPPSASEARALRPAEPFAEIAAEPTKPVAATARAEPARADGPRADTA
ncbi:hypothetical protein THAOC_29582 [Thalassiosira oceanica]|uniref:Uncharacterized protein n=1 Tax=Thalassiosira oceanica TaxID=159749 RepID=K0RDJ1_THAOC|nr:hypothetical protein THAOC_29582 [Thalassiosira oceanica]|eukprot:EJK51260.1 hypothetical protein THAOC_29582 [Thalassiosira oceanica]